jgi:hypothetical protein
MNHSFHGSDALKFLDGRGVRSKGTRERFIQEEFKTRDLQSCKEELEENSSSPTLKLGSLF